MHGAAAKWDLGSLNWELRLVPGGERHFIRPPRSRSVSGGLHPSATLCAQFGFVCVVRWHTLNMFSPWLCVGGCCCLRVCVCVCLHACLRGCKSVCILICMGTWGLESLPTVGFVKSAAESFFPPLIICPLSWLRWFSLVLQTLCRWTDRSLESSTNLTNGCIASSKLTSLSTRSMVANKGQIRKVPNEPSLVKNSCRKRVSVLHVLFLKYLFWFLAQTVFVFVNLHPVHACTCFY